MLWSVIYEFEVPENERDRVEDLLPPVDQREPMPLLGEKPVWWQTEGDEQRDLDYLCDCPDPDPDRDYEEEHPDCHCGWKHSIHQKWCAVLTTKQFREFIDYLGLTVEGEGTALGSPGLNPWYSPSSAIVFTQDSTMVSAWVTPIFNGLGKVAQRKVDRVCRRKRYRGPRNTKLRQRLRSRPLVTDNHFKRMLAACERIR